MQRNVAPASKRGGTTTRERRWARRIHDAAEGDPVKLGAMISLLERIYANRLRKRSG